MEVIKLIGVPIVIVGFILKLDTLAVVVVAGLATGLVAGMSPMQILDTLGTAFITNRTATLFILTLPAIGLCERNGLKRQGRRLYYIVKERNHRPPDRHLADHPYRCVRILPAYRRSPAVHPPAHQPDGPGCCRGSVR